MSDNNSVTVWLEQLKFDSSLAAQKLWEVYFQKMVHIARQLQDFRVRRKTFRFSLSKSEVINSQSPM